MRPFILNPILLVITLGLCLTAFTPGKTFAPMFKSPKDVTARGAMEEYIEKIEGLWISEQRDTELGESDILWIEARRTWIYQDKVWLKVSEYCRPEIAKFLVFELKDNKLQYVAAIEDDYVFKLRYLVFLEIAYQVEDGELVLYYESSEAEMQNHLNRKLRRIKEGTFDPTTI